MKHIAPPEPSRSSPHPLPDNAALGDATFARTFQHLWPYIWPHDRADLKAHFLRGVLLIAKLITIAIPYSFKWATDC